MNLSESIGVEILAEQLPDGRLESEYGLIGLGLEYRWSE